MSGRGSISIRGTLALLLAGLLPLSLTTSPAARADNPPRKILSGWIPYYGTKTAIPAALANSDLVSEVTPFWYTLKNATTIQDNYTPANPSIPIANTIASLQAAGYLILPTITDGTSTDPKTGKSIPLVLSNLLANPTSEKSIIATITNLVTINKYDGIDLDFEDFAYVDANTTWTTTQPRWVAFIQDLATSLHAQGKLLSVTTPPLFDPASGKRGYYFYAWRDIGSFIDRLRIMAYDYSTATPGPIGPITWTESAIQYAVSVMPASKVFVGIPGYGRDWVTKVEGTCPSLPINYLKTVSTKASAATFVMHDAATLAATYNATPTYNDKYGESTFTYQKLYNGTTADGSLTTCTATRTAWFQDAKAFGLRAALVAKYRLGGIAEWTFGMEDPTAITAIREVATSIAPDQVVANLQASSSTMPIGTVVTLSSSFKKKDTTAFAGIPMQIELKSSSGEWTKIYSALSQSDGSVSLPIILGENSLLRVKSDGSWDRLPGQSSEIAVNVSRIITWNPPTSMRRAVTYISSGSIFPKEAGVLVTLESALSGSWSTPPSAMTDSEGRFAIPFTLTKNGVVAMRASVAGDSRFDQSHSDFVTVLIR